MVEVVPEELVYFVNCGADAGVNPGNNNATTDVTSAPYQAVKELMAGAQNPLKNTQSDQIYGQGKTWGLSVNGTNKLTPDNTTGLQYDKYSFGWRGNTDLVYKFTLEAGSYEVTAGFREFYTNAHTREIQPQVTYKEGGKDVTKKFDKFSLTSGASGTRDTKVSKGVFTVPEDGEIEYRMVKAGGESPLVSWIGIKKIDLSDIVESIEGWDAYQVIHPGQKPELPETVEVTFADGKKKSAGVVWDKYDENELTKIFRTEPLTIGGTIADAGDKRIEVAVDVVPAALKYFIDCGTGDWGPTSRIFEPLKNSSILGLENTTSDQAYVEGTTTWGYVKTADAGSLKLTPDGTSGVSSSIYNVGVRTNTGDIVYKLTLDKGTYQFISGHHEWWANQNRVFQPEISYTLSDGSTQTVTGETVTMKNNNGANATTSTRVEIPEKALVTYTVKWIQNNAKPVLSFLAVEQDYFTGKTPDSITVTKKPNKLIYGVGGSLDLDGIEVTALYDGNITENVDVDQVSVESFDFSEAGEIPVTISYKGVKTSFTVTVDGEYPVYEDLVLMSQTFLLKGAATANNAKLFWNPVEGAAGYRIYRTDGGEKIHLASTKAVSYDIYDMEGDTTFQVEAYDAFGQLMASSNTSAAQVLTVEEDMKTWSNMPEESGAARASSVSEMKDKKNLFIPDDEEDMLISDDGENMPVFNDEENMLTSDNEQKSRAAGIQYQYKIERDDQFGTDTAKKLVEYSSADGFAAGRTVLDGNKDEALKDCKFEGVAQVTKDDQILVWAHFEKAAGYTAAELACMHGTKGGDDFALYHERPQGNDSRDMTIYRENGDMYIISSTRNNSDLNLYKLNDTWTAVLSAEEYPAVTLCAGQHREAPNLVKADGWYYLFTSEANGWFPSQGKYCAAKTLRGLSYAPLRAVHTNTFGTQSGWSSSLGGEFMLIGSRWASSGHFGEEKNWTRRFPTSFRDGYAVYQFYPEILYNNDTMIPVQDGRNLSLGQPVSTISGDTAAETGFETSFLVDGNCYDSGSYYKAGAVPYTVTVDLGQLCQITHSDITFRAVKGSDTKNPYKIYGSKDGKDFDLILDASSLNAPGFDTREIQTEDAYRYIRLKVEKVINLRNNSSASWASGIHEWTIYGDPVEQETSYDSVPVRQEWLDNRGAHIQAHGGGFLQMQDDDGTPIYYWVGEDKTHNKANFNGVNMYSSKDLVNWKFENKILKPDPTVPGLWDNKVERPKLIYNEKDETFILFGHWETADSYASSQICVAVSKTVNGDYTYLGHWRPGGTMKNWRTQGGKSYYEDDPDKKAIEPDGSLSRDMTVYVDDGTAYLVSACANDHSIAIYELDEHYTDVVPGKEYHVLVGEKLEAPAIVRAGEYYYLIGSGQSGWYPNQGRYAYTTDLTDPEIWSAIQWTGNNSTFYSQPTNIMTLTDPEGEHSYVYMGDRWYPSALRDSQYVWLPLEVGEGSVTMEYLPGWGLDSESGKMDIVKAKLLSENKPVEATPGKEGRGPEKANDGDYINTKKSGDTSDCYQPESVPGYWMVDLEEETEVSRIDIAFRMYNGSEAYHQYKVYGSKDKTNWDELVDESNNTLTGFKSHALEGSYRYIKVEISKVVNSHNNNSASWGAGLVEVQVFGEAEKPEIKNYTQKIEVTKLPDKTEYRTGEEFDPEGMEVTLTEVTAEKAKSAAETEKASSSNAKKKAKVQDKSTEEKDSSDSSAETGTEAGANDSSAARAASGTKKRVLKPSEYTVDYDFDKAGKQKVEVTYQGTDAEGNKKDFKDSFEVTVTDEENPDNPEEYYTTEIKVTKKPLKTSYYVGDEFDPEGMEVTATKKASKSNATKKVVLPNDELDVRYDFEKAAKESKVTVIYEEDIEGSTKTFKDFFHVRVDKEEQEESWYINRIYVSVKPKKLLYRQGEEFDPEGMRVTAVLKSDTNGNGSKEENLPLDELEFEYDFSEPGKKKVKVIYSGTDKKGNEKEFTASLEVTVAQAAEEGVYTERIAITKKPDKMTYYIGDTFDEKGMEVTAYQADRESGEVTEKRITNYQISPKTLMSEGKCTITVSYAAEGKDGKAKLFKDSLEVQVNKKQNSQKPTFSENKHSGNRTSREPVNKAERTWHDTKKGMVSSVQGIITGSGENYSSWNKDAQTGAWKLQYPDKSFAAGTYFVAEDGTRKEQVAWELVNGAWYAFGADGYAKGGFIQDYGLGGTFYIDIEHGMMTGWQMVDGKWYYFNPASDGKKGLMMTNITTPDGYRIGADGVWIP